MHVTSNPAIWYAARASGVAAYVVLSLVVCVGLGLGGKAQNRRWPRFSVEDVHRFGGLLVGSLIGIHVLTIAADSFLPFSLTQLLVPFTSSYRPPPSCCWRSRSRTTTESGCRTPSGGRRTTSTSPSGASPRCTG